MKTFISCGVVIVQDSRKIKNSFLKKVPNYCIFFLFTHYCSTFMGRLASAQKQYFQLFLPHPEHGWKSQRLPVGETGTGTFRYKRQKYKEEGDNRNKSLKHETK